jgi:hypothetical protein
MEEKKLIPITPITADVGGYGGECPPATQDIELNLKNRQNAIDNVGYGPLNPAEPNDVFWQDKAERWNITVREAKSAVCGNCVFFVRTPSMLECIENGIGLGNEEAEGSIEAGELGYCNSLDFKCAAERTCNAWAAGGPITEEKVEEVVEESAPVVETPEEPRGVAYRVGFGVRAEKALKKKVEDYNKYAASDRKASVAMVKAVYRRGASSFSVSQHQGTTRSRWAMTRVDAFLRLLSAGKPLNASYKADNDLLPVSHPRSTKVSSKGQAVTASGLIPEEQSLAEALVYITEKYGKFDQDGDGVWAGYTPAYENEVKDIGVKCSNCVFFQGPNGCQIISLEVEADGKCRFAVLPEGAVSGYDVPQRREDNLELLLASAYAETQLTVDLNYETPEQAILALTEFSGLGYDAEPAFRASWLRAVKNGEDPFKRASMLATMKHDSLDADLLPKGDM